MANVEDISTLLFYCRPGFEGECAQEIAGLAENGGLHGYVRCEKDSGYGHYVLGDAVAADKLAKSLAYHDLIFPRQTMRAFAHATELDAHDRMTPLLQCLEARGESFSEVWVEPPDSDSGKELALFCRKFSGALVAGLKRSRLLDKKSARRLHVFFPQSGAAVLAYSGLTTSAPWPQGIPRLKFPKDAPSRSTLKLDEAFQILLTQAERESWLKPGMHAVDLGAAPGGWTWQLVRRSIQVIAVDNGPMDPKLLDSGLVNHVRADGFGYRPARNVDWLVCDMVEQPRRVAELMAVWLVEARCRFCIFNLKLPMKKRYAEVQSCLRLIQDSVVEGGASADLRAKQLYHDREEITVFARVK